MQKAVDIAKKALHEKAQISKLVTALNLAESCFERWSLIGKKLREHMSFFKTKRSPCHKNPPAVGTEALY